MITEILMMITKQLIAIIIVSLDNNKQFNYNKNRQNITKIGRNNDFLWPVFLSAKIMIKNWINN